MQCPACGRELTTVSAAGVTLDACRGGCGGVWFDRGELKRFDEPSETATSELLDIPRDPSVSYDPSARRRCPHCDDVVMMQHSFSSTHKVVVDECPSCGGYWLDPGELASIRAEFSSEDGRDAADSAYFEALFGGELAKERALSQEELERAHRVARMLRFICPSYYIPGKQDGAAF